MAMLSRFPAFFKYKTIISAQLRLATTSVPLGKEPLKVVNLSLSQQLSAFANSPDLHRIAKETGIDSQILLSAAPHFTTEIMRGKIENVNLDKLRRMKNELPRYLYPLFFKFLTLKYRKETGDKLTKLIGLTQISDPALSYPDARTLKRKVIMHIGPTNSGKTYTALQNLAAAPTGIYCGPLRLLAHEVYERMNKNGVPFNLLTGENKLMSQDVNRWSCTIEMAFINQPFDVGVIDEIQMIADEQRGWAWTQAFLGLQARELHLCGEPSAVDLIQKLCSYTGDELEIKTYKRLTGLKVADKCMPLHWNNNIQKGDAIITFSRKDIFRIKSAVEKATKFKAAVIYGNLPPETRADQANLFNDPDGQLEILVASDAIGMGLNLNIKRILFATIEKFNGLELAQLSSSQIKQIGGRAGRFGTQFEDGTVSAFNPNDLKKIIAAFKMPVKQIGKAGVAPSQIQILKLSEILGTSDLSVIFRKFQELTQLTSDFFICDLDQQIASADMIASIDLTMGDRFTLVNAPSNYKIRPLSQAFLAMVESYSLKAPITISNLLKGSPLVPANNSYELNSLEIAHKILVLYQYLAQRFPFFEDEDECVSLKAECEFLIDDCLHRLGDTARRGPIAEGAKNLLIMDNSDDDY